jgi:phosphoenolpyruvate carboxylase
MEALYTTKTYQELLAHHREEQVIMLGFSDGTKDGGYLQANWSIYQAKAELTRISRAQGIKVIFFDGRGGPPARGGGNTHKFYASLGQNVAQKAIELTIQGQTISSKFGNQPSARFNMEQLLTAGLSRQLFPHDRLEISPQEQTLLSKVAELSYTAYQDLKNHPRFLEYLQEITTLPYYGQTNIGSRPVKRKGDGQLRFEDHRAIPFVGSWSQMKQNVPGFYGWGSALKALDEQGRLAEVRELYQNAGFFKALVDNSLMALAKTNFALTQYLAGHPRFGDFWKKLKQEYQDSLYYLKAISGQEELLQSSPVTQHSVKLREELVLPLIVIQQYALQKIQSLKAEGVSEEALTAWHKLVMRSMFGNINATRNAA